MAFVVTFLLALVSVQSVHVTPIGKVTEMMQALLAKGKEAKHQEEVEFAKFHEWCDNVKEAKTKSIAEGADQITQLSADIDTATSEATVLKSEIDELLNSIAQMTKERDNATAIRQKERADYEAQHGDFSESITAINKAIQVLSTRSADVPQALAQLRVSSSLSSHARAAIESFLALSDDATGVGAPDANAYEFQSGGVIDMLEKLAAKFKEQRLALQKAELNARSNYELLMQGLFGNMEAAKKAVSEKTQARAGRVSDAAAAKGDLEITEKAKTEDEKVLSDTNSECHLKAEEFEKNQVTRAAEVKAIEKAIEIISSEVVKGHAETYLPSAALIQRKATALAHLRNAEQGNGAGRSQAAAYLQAAAQRLDSHYLSVVAAHVTEDPFAKVKKLIKDLIVKLMEEANEEADHHAYCTSELAMNKQTRETKSTGAEQLTAKVDALTADISQLATEITELSDAIAEIKGQQAEAVALRGDDKADNNKTVADAKEAQAAVERAIEVLREFYGSTKEASLLQRRSRAASGANLREPYKGMVDDSTGVLGMLEVILSDFARLETETSTAEGQAAAAHKQYMAESTQDAEVTATELEHKEKQKLLKSGELESTKTDLELTQAELQKALDYYDALKADCVDTGLSYEERVKRREEEIKSLQEALKILSGEDLA